VRKAAAGPRRTTVKTRKTAVRPQKAPGKPQKAAAGPRKAPAKPRSAARSVEVVLDGAAPRAAAAPLARFCGKALRTAGYSQWEVAVLLCGDARIQELNHKYRGKWAATDVLSFPREGGRKGDPVCGDLAVSLDTLSRNADRFGTSENEEMKRLLVHGLLHLAGMDHGTGRTGKMLALQERLLTGLRSEQIYGEKRR